MEEIKVESYEKALKYEALPEVFRVDYDLWELRISLSFENNKEPVYVVFDSTRGYRVLDEGDLLEFWNPESRAEGWLWKVLKGGWSELESTRDGFVTGVIGGYEEYLILGENECVSVISSSPPVIYSPNN